jgi:hypothetical protein
MERQLAFALVSHDRVGKGNVFNTLPSEVMRQILEQPVSYGGGVVEVLEKWHSYKDDNTRWINLGFAVGHLGHTFDKMFHEMLERLGNTDASLCHTRIKKVKEYLDDCVQDFYPDGVDIIPNSEVEIASLFYYMRDKNARVLSIDEALCDLGALHFVVGKLELMPEISHIFKKHSKKCQHYQFKQRFLEEISKCEHCAVKAQTLMQQWGFVYTNDDYVRKGNMLYIRTKDANGKCVYTQTKVLPVK